MSSRHRIRLELSAACALGAALLFGACEGGSSSSGNGGGGSQDNTGPLVVIQFPTDGSLTDAATATLAMVATDGAGVASLSVGGVHATLAGSLWNATVPLVAGNNLLTVEAVDDLGNRNASAAQLRIRREGALWVDAAKVAFDSGRGEALVLDRELGALFGVNTGSGARTLRFGPGVGTGGPFPDARDVDYVASRDAAVVVDGELDAVLLVALANGARTTLSSPTVGSGPTPLDLFGVAVDEARNRVLVVDDIRSELMAVDLSTGARTTISADAVGTGPSLVGPRSVAVDLARNRALVTLSFSRAVVAVDLATGNRTVLSGGSAAPAFVTPADIVVDVFQDRALVADPDAAALFAVDLTTGAREILSSFGTTTIGLGPGWSQPSGVVLHLGSVPLVVDPALDALFEVGATSGDRRSVSQIALGNGPSFTRPTASALARGDDQLLSGTLVVADSNTLFRFLPPGSLPIAAPVDDGFRQVLSGPTRGSGAPFVALADVAVSGAGSALCILALDAGLPGIVRVDPALGDRTLVSGTGVGSGTPFAGPLHIVPEIPTAGACAPTALVLDAPIGGPSRLLRVDLTSGDRTVLSDAQHGTGVGFLDPAALEIDVGSGLAYVLDNGLPAILSVDLVSGNRTVVFQSPTAFVEPTDMCLDFGQQRFLIVDAGAPALLAANLFPPSLTVLSSAQHGTGLSLPRPESVVLVEAPGIVEETIQMIPYVVDSARGAILALNPISGDRVLETK